MGASRYTLENAKDFVGQEVGLSEWMEIGQKRIDGFADVTEDHQWIHTDSAQARNGPFGASIAHGLLILSLTVKLAESAGALPGGTSMCVNYGYDRIRFPAPVPAGKRVRCRTLLISMNERAANQLLLTMRHTVEIEGEEKPAVVADCIGLYYK